MKHSENYEKVKDHYDHHRWNIARVRKAVACGWITEEEFTEITRQPY